MKNGNTQYKCRVINCIECTKQISGKNILGSFNNQLGNWEDKVRLTVSTKQASKDANSRRASNYERNNAGTKTVGK